MKPSFSFLVIPVLFLCQLVVPGRAQETISMARTKGQTALVSVEVKINGSMERTENEKTKKDRLKVSRQLEFLDQINKVGSSERVKHTFEGSRYYIRYELDENGEQVDPSLVGVNLKIGLRDDGQINVAASHEEYVDNDYVNSIGPRISGLGFGPGADITIRPDGLVDNFDLRGLVPLLIAAPERIEAVEGQVQVLERNEEKGLLILGGPTNLVINRRRGTLDMSWKYELEARFTVELKSQRIVSASATGKVHGEGYEGDGKISFEGEVDAEATVDIAANVEKEMKRKIKLRDVDFKAGNSGISFQAPSSYFYRDQDDNVGYRFLSSTNGQAKVRVIGIRFSRNDSPQDVVDEEAKKFRGQSGFEVDKVSMKGGKGISIVGKSKEGTHMITAETYAVKGGVISLRYDVPIAEAKEGAAELKRVRKTLKFDR